MADLLGTLKRHRLGLFVALVGLLLAWMLWSVKGALAAFNRDYMSGIKELLADLYDSPPTYERLVGQRTITATNVASNVTRKWTVAR